MSAEDIALNIVLGVISGLAASIGFWVWTARLKHPSVTICPALSFHDRYGKPRSTVALVNKGKRPAADISIIAELSLNGISKNNKRKKPLNISLRVREERLPYLTFAKEEQYFLRPTDIIWNYRDDFRKDLPTKLGILLSHDDGQEFTLREILEDAESEGLDARIQVYVIANDSVYGSSSYPIREFRSKDFLDGDFVPGKRCTLMGASTPNPKCCQFPNTPLELLRHYAYYRKVRSECLADTAGMTKSRFKPVAEIQASRAEISGSEPLSTDPSNLDSLARGDS